MPDDKFGFGRLKNNIVTLKRDIPIVLANQAQNYFSHSFLTQSFDGVPWKEVERRKPGTSAYKYPKKKDLGRRTRPILVGKGSTKLRRAVNNSIQNKVWPIVRLVVDLPYAKAHNEGEGKMPQRKYMGVTNELTEMHRKKIDQLMKKLWT